MAFSTLFRKKCVVGNSSVGIRETSYLGTPSVSIGSRQKNRESAENVIRCKVDSIDIEKKLVYQINHGKYKSSILYGDGHASERIAEYLLSIKIVNEKFFEGGKYDK